MIKHSSFTKKPQKLGNADAQFYVAEYYYKFYNGEIVLSDEDKNNAFKKTAEYYEKAALQDHAKAQYAYFKISFSENYIYDTDSKKPTNPIFNLDRAMIYLKRVAEHGNANAQYQLGNCYNYGKGTEENSKKIPTCTVLLTNL